MLRRTFLTLPLAAALARRRRRPDEGLEVRGMTISCQTWGREWGTDAFARELDELAALGVNWVAIHPYAWVRRDGRFEWRSVDPAAPPEWLARPVAEAHARGLRLLLKPHLGYWGSPFSWRGEIDYPDPAERARFFADYRAFAVELAAAVPDADAFCVGTELERLVLPEDEAAWRGIAAAVRAETDAHLTYAANWDGYERVGFWDALDAVGVQAYFPLAASDDPTDEELRAGWVGVLDGLARTSARTGKPVVFTELGYDAAPWAAREPWLPAHGGSHGRRAPRPGPTAEARRLQERLLRLSLEVLARERDWLRGAFLWKWFPGEGHGSDFLMDTPEVRALLDSVWGARARGAAASPGPR